MSAENQVLDGLIINGRWNETRFESHYTVIEKNVTGEWYEIYNCESDTLEWAKKTLKTHNKVFPSKQERKIIHVEIMTTIKMEFEL